MDSPLQPVVTGWLKKIEAAMQFKKAKFQDDADEAMTFFNGPYDFLYGPKHRGNSRGFVFLGGDDVPQPAFGMTVNKVAEMVQLFGPVLYHRNPIRQVNPRKEPLIPIELFGDPGDPNVQAAYAPLVQQVQQTRGVDLARAKLLESYLNYTPNALDLKTESRNAIDEAIIKGMGVLWPELYTPRGSQTKMVGSFFDTVDNLLIDPDVETLAEAKWIARRCIHPVWEVEQTYGYPPGTIKGNLESLNMQSMVQAMPALDYRKKMGLTNDLLVYWKVYSKMGIGGRMIGMPAYLKPELEKYGEFCFVVVCETTTYPLNIPPQLTDSSVATMNSDQEIMTRLQWPTPYWADDAWPFVPLAFHWVPREVWPMSHLKPGMGELKFINWAHSFVAGKIKTACRDLIAIQKSAGEELKNTILSGTDYELIEIDRQHGTITEVVQFLQHPAFQGDVWKVIEAVERNFEKRVGLTELMYGESAASYRSAQEANLKGDQVKIRPDDMANKVEDMMGQVARQEALAARWHLEPQDVQPMLGNIGSQFWGTLLVPSDPGEILHQLEYRIEAGSAKKPNQDRQIAIMNQAVQTLLPVFQQFAMATADWTPLNNLLGDWAKSIELDPARYQLRPPPPPPPMPPGPPGPGGPGPQGPPPGPPPR